ncbi:uncharacterized protein ISCGN_010715 [Ixodes scapularis]
MRHFTEQHIKHSKAIKRLQQSKCRLTKRNTELKTVVSDLVKQNILLKEDGAVLQSFGAANQQLLQRQLAKHTGAPVPTQYSPELRAFALTLHFYSLRAYTYVRKVFDTCLPHPRTLTKWYQSTDGEPGFSEEALRALKLKSKANTTSGIATICSLMVDEMSIRRHLEWDGQKYAGYMDVGSGVDDDSLPLAKNASVIMAVAINGRWKIPLGYFLVDGLGGEQRANLVVQGLTHAHETGALVVSLTCDGEPANFSTLRELGCDFSNMANLRTTFPHPVTQEPVATFMDPCHMLKLVRNALCDKKAFIGPDGEAVAWHFIEQLHVLQQHEGLHLANKLRLFHVDWKRQPMKVSLAAQVLSMSVADALNECRSLSVAGFLESQPTETFLQIFNNLFDVLNSRNVHQKNWKKPLCPQNIRQVEDLFRQADAYLSSLRDSHGGPTLLHTNRKTGFLGLRICMKSLLTLYNFLDIEKQLLKYLPAHKVSQDNLELFFGTVRSFGRQNGNPTARQFSAAFKRLIIQNEIKDVETGNCLPLDEVGILNASSGTVPVADILNHTIPRWKLMPPQDEASEDASNDYCLNPGYITECCGRIVTYIAGFLVRSLRRSLLCEISLSSLTTEPNANSTYSRVRRKTRGGLLYPSEGVIKIARKCEQQVRTVINRGKLSGQNVAHKMVANVLEVFIDKGLFVSIRDHICDTGPLENHYVLLVRSVAERYINLRLHHAGKQMAQDTHLERVRQMYRKLTQFKGQ